LTRSSLKRKKKLAGRLAPCYVEILRRPGKEITISPRAIGAATLAVLRAIADGHRYGFEIIDRTGLPSGTVYPALTSLERRGLVTARWEGESAARAEARPRRRYYRVTGAGQAALVAAIERLKALGLGVVVHAPRGPDGAGA
jgi:DNA-binding MarR family transcriptional regulator